MLLRCRVSTRSCTEAWLPQRNHSPPWRHLTNLTGVLRNRALMCPCTLSLLARKAWTPAKAGEHRSKCARRRILAILTDGLLH